MNHNRQFVVSFLAFSFICFLFNTLPCGGEAITPNFDKVDLNHVKTLILPKPKESKWLTINWETDLWKARQRAAKLGKPILLWEMDGNPMGCT